ncbi:hypothetical protein [Pyrobaculum islandicum]|nr:hypothetical protein [Pyrobaculum islandicum]
MKVIKTYETTRIMVKAGIFTLFVVLTLTGILPTDGGNVKGAIF